MKISLKAGGLFVKRLPAGTAGNTAELDVPEGSTLHNVLDHLGIATGGRYLLVVNGKAVPPSGHVSYVLNDGDAMSVMPPLKGG